MTQTNVLCFSFLIHDLTLDFVDFAITLSLLFLCPTASNTLGAKLIIPNQLEDIEGRFGFEL